jgi:hypothetical protein
MEQTISPNADTGAATEQSAVPSMESIAAKMTAMRAEAQAVRNQLAQSKQSATGIDNSAEISKPVDPSNAESEVVEPTDDNIEEASHESVVPNEVNETSNDSTSEELIDFIEFAESNPNAKFRFTRNGKEVVIDAKKASSILGQGAAISEDARQLKIERADFDEYVKESRARQEGLTLAMEFTIQPKLKNAYDEILKTQGYQSTFQQQLNNTNDSAQRARIEMSMRQNEQYIRQQQQIIGELKPAVDEFRKIRSEQVSKDLVETRKRFKDSELKNEYVFNELRDKVSKLWPESQKEIIPGIPNIDLISSDENLFSLIRDGLKYRDKPVTKSAGSSLAVLTSKRPNSANQRGTDDSMEKLRQQARAGDKKAGDNLLMQRLQQIRSSRGGR